MKILQVCTGRSRAVVINGRKVLSAIGKTAIAGPVAARPLGLEGDEQADPSRHGGLSKAVYAYPSEHLPFWQMVRAQAKVALFDEPISAGLMGENLLLEGLTEERLWIGDRLLLPNALLAVSEPRTPCFKFGAAMGFPQAVRLMAQSGYCGAYLSVVEGGTVQADDTITLLPGPREVNLRELFRRRVRS